MNPLHTSVISAVKSLVKAMKVKDGYTGRHSEQVALRMAEFAIYLNLTPEEQDQAYWAGLVHDIGKIGIPEEILNKPGRLSEAEFNVIRRHPALGADIIREMAELAHIADVVRGHHERYDGRGYPDGLAGEAIPYLSRMMALCDSYDAMTTVRCYSPAMSKTSALNEIEQGLGRQYDPQLGQQFIEWLRSQRESQEFVS